MSTIYVAITIPERGCLCGCLDPQAIGAFSTEEAAKAACQAAYAAGNAEDAADCEKDPENADLAVYLREAVLGWREEPDGSGYWVASDDGFETRGGRAFTVTAHELDAMPAPEPAAAATA
jgi:hypothetical protein